jgi:hypothetical protein
MLRFTQPVHKLHKYGVPNHQLPASQLSVMFMITGDRFYTWFVLLIWYLLRVWPG